jgi:hypothetical protein
MPSGWVAVLIFLSGAAFCALCVKGLIMWGGWLGQYYLPNQPPKIREINGKTYICWWIYQNGVSVEMKVPYSPPRECAPTPPQQYVDLGGDALPLYDRDGRLK